MNKTVFSLIMLILGTAVFGHGIETKQVSPVYTEQVNNQQNLTVSQMVDKGHAAYKSKNYTEAMSWYRKAADQGNKSAQFWLGYMYDSGKGVTENDAEAVRWYRKAADQGDAGAQYYLGWLCEFGQGTPIDETEALKLFRKSADQGYAVAQERLGYMYDKGIIVTQDYAEALAWYRKAADQGNADAQQNLGDMYFYAKGVARNIPEAKSLWEKAAAQGNTQAKKNIENNFDNNCKGLVSRGDNALSKKNYKEALSCYLYAAEQGNASAQNSLGYMYFWGFGVDSNYATALKWYRKSADKGNAGAQSTLGFMYEYGFGVDSNTAEAAKWYRKSADQGNAGAQYNLGRMYSSGTGVDKDFAEATRWFRKSADKGNADAQCSLGYLYQFGYGVAQDYDEAVRWYRKSSWQDNSGGQNNLGYMYQFGYGVKKDYKEALRLYRLSADQANPSAQFNLGEMYYNGYGVKKDYSEAISWYRKSADQGNDDAQCALGEMYYNGLSLPKDDDEARKWWEKAAAQGNIKAENNLKKLPNPSPAGTFPSFYWVECPTKTDKSQFTLKVGVNSPTAIKEYNVFLNGSATRGIKTVKNDGYDFSIDQILTLAEGNNEIRVEAANASGKTVETRSVIYEKTFPPSPTPVQTQKKIALVVGNAAYSNQPLRNTLNDANAIAAELRGLGFDVMMLGDASRKELDIAVNNFGLRARNYDVAMFYYAGHGIQYRGENYLVPIDAILSSESDIEYECTNVNRVLSKLDESGVKMKIISLDACRDNPFKRSWHRGGSAQGLSAINTPVGTLISYATSPGAVAADGEGAHSPYTAALLQVLKEENLPIENVFKKVASIVVSATGNAQVPWYLSSLFEGEFIFNPSHK